MGGFGSQAFLGCVHREDGIKPAVMVFLPDEIVDNAELFRRVWSETELGTFIDHVNVIGVMGVARLDEGYARVVEYADAESLRSVYRRATTLKKAIPPTIACAIVADACMGAHYAHELGVMETGEPMIHGGIRPETLQVSFKGMGKVTGYGATTIAEIARKARGTDNVKDSYAAPEQSYGGRNATTIQTDVYALGCVMYEALTGKAPFAADNDLAEAMIRDELSRPQYEGVTDSMAMIVLRATRKKSSDRYQSALEMRMDILDKCEHATEIDIRHFMDELFPPETVPRATRDQMLIAAREKPPAPTGRLLTEIPPELDRRAKSRAAVPSDAEVEAAQGRIVEVTPVHQKAPPPEPRRVDDPTENIHTAATRPPQTAEGLVDLTNDAEPITAPTAPHPIIGGRARDEDGRNDVPPSRAEPTAVVRRDNIPTPGKRERPPSPAPAPSWQAAPTMPPQYPTQPPVVYRTSPAILVGFGAAGALAIALVGYVLLQDDKPPPQVIVQAPPPPPPPPPPPVVETPPPVDDPPVGATSTHKGSKGTKTSVKDDPPPKPVATGPGKIVVSASPASMVISVNGSVLGNGSATFEGKAGTYKVVAKDKTLGAVSSRTVKLKAGQTVEVELTAEQGTLTFDQLPDGVDVFVDGKRVGKTPMPAIKLYAGPHKVMVKKGGAEVALNATIVANRELFITAQFGE
jgi:hypothetical protein